MSCCHSSTPGWSTQGWVTDGQFLAGYGATQAVPGPLFTFAAFLGTVAAVPPAGVLGGVVSLVPIFLPAFLLVSTAAVATWVDIAMVASAFALLLTRRVPPIVVVVLCAVTAQLLATVTPAITGA